MGRTLQHHIPLRFPRLIGFIAGPLVLFGSVAFGGQFLPHSAAAPSPSGPPGLASIDDPPAPAGAIRVKLLAVNDLHGGLSTGQEIGERPVGGAAYLAAHVKARAAAAQHAYVVGAGDMFGASAPVSGLLREEPTVRVMNAMGFLLNAPGNHELDRGVEEFLRMTRGGCHPQGGCFEGSNFPYISANIIVEATGAPLLRPYLIERVEGVPVAFIGVTHTNVPSLTRRGAVDGLVFIDPAAAVNYHVERLRAEGIRAFVVLVHEGGWLDHGSSELRGPITEIVGALDPDVDLVISAHTHQRYVARHAGKLVTQGYADSVAFVDADLVLDPTSGDVVDVQAQVVTTYQEGIAPEPTVEAIVQEAEARIRPSTERRLAVAAREISKVEQSDAGETPLGDLIAEAQRWSTGVDVALVNLFSIRASLPAGIVTWGDAYVAQAYSNDLVTMTLSGDQLYRLFNQQWTTGPDGVEVFRPIQVAGLRVTWASNRPHRGDRVVSLVLPDGRLVQRSDQYSVVANEFMATGGDGCLVLLEGGDRRVQARDVDALADYLQQLPQPFDVRLDGRIRRLG